MIRRAFTMRLKPDSLEQYKYHHDNIWPDLVAEIERAGIGSISTFQRGLDLFLVSEICDESAWDRLWNSPAHRRWAELMEPLMHLREDGIVDAHELTEVFHLVTSAGDHGAVMATVLVDEFGDESGEDEDETVAVDYDSANGDGDGTDLPAEASAAERLALADALSALSAALDREGELREASEEPERSYVTMEIGSGELFGRDPLAELIADTLAHAEPLRSDLLPAASFEPPGPLPHAPRRRKVLPKVGKKKPVAKRSAKSKKKLAAKTTKHEAAPSAAKRAKKSGKKTVLKKQIAKRPAKKAVKKSAKSRKPSAVGRAKRR
jgi:L-rhamnose mutarotase